MGVHDNVVVPEGSTCTLDGTQVQGNVKVEKAASLHAIGALIRGNVEGSDVVFVLLQFETEVGGNVQVKGGAPGTTSGFDINVRVGGDALVEGNLGTTFIDAATIVGDVDVLKNGGFVEFEFNTVGGNANVVENSGGLTAVGNAVTGNMKVEKNVGPAEKQVVGNTVAQNLQCFENAPPFLGGPNVAAKSEGQCF